MKNLWNESDAANAKTDLDLRVYSSRLLGSESDLVLHGGGNTSVKSSLTNLFGEEEDILFVKGSGWDLKTIEAPGFSPCRLKTLLKLASLDSLSDSAMTRELKASMTDPGAPSPSVEAILHAIIPGKHVDHTHTDAVVAISNTADGEAVLSQLFGPRVLILPYVMPGFVLAQQVYRETLTLDWKTLDGIVLMHHGLFTFSDDAKLSYDKMIDLVTLAEDYLKQQSAFDNLNTATFTPEHQDLLSLADARRRISVLTGNPSFARWKLDNLSVGYSALDDVASFATRGPVTPDHSLHTKRIPAIIDDDPLAAIDHFCEGYKQYFDNHTDGTLTCLDPAPRFAVWQNKGVLTFAPTIKKMGVISDIVDHTIKAVQWGEHLGGWVALSEQDIFDIEYWELEQAKLKLAPASAPCDGKIALVTGAANGIGRASVEALVARGAAVIALDISDTVLKLQSSQVTAIVCDVTSDSAVMQAISQGVANFGGLDMLISNAGNFPQSRRIADLDNEELQRSLDLNFSSHVRLMRLAVPFLERGIDPAIVLIASKNVPAPGPGAGAYSAAKAALTQIGRVAALEMAQAGIRVNTLHPNAVFDTAIWTDDVLQERAEHYGLTVDEYKRNNLLQTEITSADIARLAITLCGADFAKTTGAQIPIDGGNERVI